MTTIVLIDNRVRLKNPKRKNKHIPSPLLKLEELVIIKSVMESKDYSTLRALLKKQQTRRFKINNTQPVEDYLSQQKIDYEVYNKFFK